MASVNYGDVRRCLANRREYKHGSSHAERGNSFYRVYSYSTLMLEYNLVSGELVYFDDAYYSSTTSRLQNMLRVAFNIEREQNEINGH